MKERKFERFCENIAGIILGVVTLGYYRIVLTSTHHEMMEEYSRPPLFMATYRQFRDEFNLVDWTWSSEYKRSLFGKQDNDSFHASIIEMHGIGFCMTSYGLLRANKLRRMKIKEIRQSKLNNDRH